MSLFFHLCNLCLRSFDTQVRDGVFVGYTGLRSESHLSCLLGHVLTLRFHFGQPQILFSFDFDFGLTGVSGLLLVLLTALFKLIKRFLLLLELLQLISRVILIDFEDAFSLIC